MRIRVGLGSLMVVALLLSAGCSGFTGGGSADRDPYEVPSPTPSPTPTPTVTTTEFGTGVETVAPGIGADGISSVLDAVTAHTRGLNGVGFRVNQTTVLKYRNGTTARTTRMAAEVARNGTKHIVREDGSTVRSVFLGDGGGYVRTVTDEAVTYARENESDFVIDPNSPIRFDLTYKAKMYRYYRAMSNVSVGPAEREGEARIATDDVDANYVDILVRGDVTNVSVEIVVTADGIVKRFRTRYTLHRNGSVYRVEDLITFSGVGETTVAPPEWVAEARRVLEAKE